MVYLNDKVRKSSYVISNLHTWRKYEKAENNIASLMVAHICSGIVKV